jgi:MFS family permease
LARVTRIYYGWNVAIAAFLSTGITVGVTGYAFGAFVEPLEAEFGWSRTEINGALALSVVSGLVAPISGRLMDRYGARPVMVSSLLLISLGLLLRSATHELWHFYLFTAISSIGMPGATILPAGRLVGIWFPLTSGRMMSFVTAGNNFGGLTIVPLAASMIALAGWRWGFASLGLLVLALAVVVLLVVRENAPRNAASTSESDSDGAPESGGLSGITRSEALRSPAFYLIAIGVTGGAFTYSVVLTQLIPHLESEGFNRGAAAGALTAIASVGLIGKFVFGFVSERISARPSFIITLAIQAIGLLLFIVAGGSQLIWLAVVVFGLGFGGMGVLNALIVSDTFGIRAFGSIMGLVTLAGIIPHLVGPIVAGVIFDASDSYTMAFALVIVLYLIGAAALLMARPQQPTNADPHSTQPI